MEDVKWIKVSTLLRTNRKIKYIRTLQNGDTLALLWVFLLCLAGDINDNGMIYLAPGVPYTTEMIAEEFNMDAKVVRYGLNTFHKFSMIALNDGVICISKWEKWQSVDKMEAMRDQTRQRVARHREKQRQLASTVSGHSGALQGNEGDVTPCNVTCNADVTLCNATDIEGEVDIEGDKEKNNNLFIHDSEKNFFTSPENPEKPAAKHKFDAETLAAKQADYRAAIRKALTLGGEDGEKRAYDYERIANLIGIPGVSVAAIREELNAEKEDHVSA